MFDSTMTAALDSLMATCLKSLDHNMKLHLQPHLEVPTDSDEATEQDTLYWQWAFEARDNFVAVPVYAHLTLWYPESIVQVACSEEKIGSWLESMP